MTDQPEWLLAYLPKLVGRPIYDYRDEAYVIDRVDDSILYVSQGRHMRGARMGLRLQPSEDPLVYFNPRGGTFNLVPALRALEQADWERIRPQAQVALSVLLPWVVARYVLRRL